jgi:hypothetical protein
VFGNASATTGRCRVLRRDQCTDAATTRDVGPGSCVSVGCER